MWIPLKVSYNNHLHQSKSMQEPCIQLSGVVETNRSVWCFTLKVGVWVCEWLLTYFIYMCVFVCRSQYVSVSPLPWSEWTTQDVFHVATATTSEGIHSSSELSCHLRIKRERNSFFNIPGKWKTTVLDTQTGMHNKNRLDNRCHDRKTDGNQVGKTSRWFWVGVRDCASDST